MFCRRVATILTTVAFIITLTGMMITAACTQTNSLEHSSIDSDSLRVVTTVSPITSLAENIGGQRIQVIGIIPEGTNSHTYEPAPSIARTMASADVIILNGLFLEQPSLKMANESKQQDATILQLGNMALTKEEWVHDFSFPKSGGYPNPHLWTDPMLALKYAELILDIFVAKDPNNTDYYHSNFTKLESRIRELDERTQEAVSTIPLNNRKLLTYHDSFPYFSMRYGFTVIGAVQPSDFREPSAREVANLINQIEHHQVPAIFGSEVFPSDIMEQIAKESGASFVRGLRDDDLPGKSGDGNHTYLGLMVSDVEIIVSSLGGNVQALDEFDTSLVFEGSSIAIYPD